MVHTVYLSQVSELVTIGLTMQSKETPDFTSETSTEALYRRLDLLYEWFEENIEYKERHAVSPSRMWRIYNNEHNTTISLKSFYNVLRSFLRDKNAKERTMLLVRKSEGYILLNAVLRSVSEK